jgi:ubiquitin C-terminal hydrolase
MQKYQANELCQSFGIRNYGVTCYFNTLIQSILSCPVIRQTLVRVRDKYTVKCQVARALLSLWETPHMSASACDEILTCMFARNRRLEGYQQDISEAFLTILDILECIPEVYQLFQHKYNTQIYCTDCEAIVSSVNEFGTIFQIQPNLNGGQSEKFAKIDPTYNRSQSLNNFLMKVNTCTDKDFKCPKCNHKGEKFKTTMLQMIPEILPILLKKYDEKTITDFPEFLEFPSVSSGTKLIYHLVAQSEHSGTRHGGHYWAICRRSDGWYQFNDMSISPASFGPRSTSYMLWYCYLDTKPL